MPAADPRRIELAYENQAFLGGEEGRPLRILAEYLEPLTRFRLGNVHDTVVFFGSARLTSDGPLGHYYRDAREVARLLTMWSKELSSHAHRFVVCSGGGGGIMEAANRGAADAGGRSVGLNISLPKEQQSNPYISRDLSFGFHYFFMRKLWFAHLARALVVFPGGFGTLDELTEILTLAQTRKLEQAIPIILYGKSYWTEVINFDALVRHGMIDSTDTALFHYADDPVTALALLKRWLQPHLRSGSPSFAHSCTHQMPPP